jgi:hypothetical protein
VSVLHCMGALTPVSINMHVRVLIPGCAKQGQFRRCMVYRRLLLGIALVLKLIDMSKKRNMRLSRGYFSRRIFMCKVLILSNAFLGPVSGSGQHKRVEDE